MATELEGQKIAILDADGVEPGELEQPRDAVRNAGATAGSRLSRRPREARR